MRDASRQTQRSCCRNHLEQCIQRRVPESNKNKPGNQNRTHEEVHERQQPVDLFQLHELTAQSGNRDGMVVR